MKAKNLIEFLSRHPEAEVVVMCNEDYENKCNMLSPYYDNEGKVVIQYWDSNADSEE